MNKIKLILLVVSLLPLMAMAQTKFIITGSGNSFTAKQNGGAIAGAENKPIQDVINVIKGVCGSGCEIQFGDGSTVLDIGNSGIEFEGNWGEITLTGKITSNAEFLGGIIFIYDGVSATSKADIKNTSDFCGYGAIRNNGGKLTINDGNIEAKCSTVDNNDGKLTINSGNIKAEECAVDNHGIATISNGDIEAETGSVCNHYTELTIDGGNIKAEYNAVINDGDIFNGESALITISGGNIEAEFGTVYNMTGEIIISGGNIKAIEGAVANDRGKITISSGTIEARYGAVINFNAEAEWIDIFNNERGEITISGGTIKAIVAAVVNYEGNITINGGNIMAMGVTVLNLDTRALALEAVKLVISGGSISIIPGDIPLDLILELKDVLTDLLNADELDLMDLSKYAVYLIGDENYFSLSEAVEIVGEVKSIADKNSPIIQPQIANSQIRIKTAANAIIFENLPRNAKVDIYNLQGKLVSSKSFNQMNNGQITVRGKGIYFAKIGSQTFRITVK